MTDKTKEAKEVNQIKLEKGDAALVIRENQAISLFVTNGKEKSKEENAGIPQILLYGLAKKLREDSSFCQDLLDYSLKSLESENGKR